MTGEARFFTRPKAQRHFGCLVLVCLFASAAGTQALDFQFAAGLDMATRHVRRGADLPTANQGIAAFALGASESATGLSVDVSGRAVVSDRGAPFRTRDLDEILTRLGWKREVSLGSRLISVGLGLDAYLYPRRISAGYGALVMEPRVYLAFPQVRIQPSFTLAIDTTPLQTGAYWEVGAVTTTSIGRFRLEIGGTLGWVESYLKQDTPDIVPTTQAAGVIGFLAALAPAVAELTVAAPMGREKNTTSVRLIPYIRGSLVSPLVQSMNEDDGEIVLGLRVDFKLAPWPTDQIADTQ